ncbi:MAG: glutamate--tRNA ligase family protein, partial [Myxococcota bacterium]
TTGEAHPGTLLSAMLVWLDARHNGLRTEVRYEDLDPQRSTPERRIQMREDLAWLGIDFDRVTIQSEFRARHEFALDQLEAQGLLYPCAASRAELRAVGTRAPDDAFAYDNRGRARSLPAGGWRSCDEPIRVRLPDRTMRLEDESGAVVEHALSEFGDPVVRRRDGAVAYQLASVVDDAASDVSRVVRGRDLLAGTLVQMALQDLLELPRPRYRHHFLLLERRDEKFSKLHGAVGVGALREKYTPHELIGILANVSGLASSSKPVALDAIDFDWQRVRAEDLLMEVSPAGELVWVKR